MHNKKIEHVESLTIFFVFFLLTPARVTNTKHVQSHTDATPSSPQGKQRRIKYICLRTIILKKTHVITASDPWALVSRGFARPK